MAKATKKTSRSRKISSLQRQQSPANTSRPPANRTQTLLVLLLVVVSFFSGYLFFKLKSLESGAVPQGGQAQLPQQRPTNVKAAKPSLTGDHWRGSKDARYVWVEYSDLECPFCKTIHPNLVKLMSEYQGKIAWVYRHYPLSFHQNAQKEAEASECAAEQGGNDAFWKFIDAIFEKTTSNGTGFALDKLTPLAQELGLNSAQFKQCLDSGKYEKKVKDQLAQGTKEGVQATPTSVVFDTKTGRSTTVEGAVPYDQLKQAVDQALSQN